MFSHWSLNPLPKYRYLYNNCHPSSLSARSGRPTRCQNASLFSSYLVPRPLFSPERWPIEPKKVIIISQERLAVFTEMSLKMKYITLMLVQSSVIQVIFSYISISGSIHSTRCKKWSLHIVLGRNAMLSHVLLSRWSPATGVNLCSFWICEIFKNATTSLCYTLED